jgi:hypothetical protein
MNRTRNHLVRSNNRHLRAAITFLSSSLWPRDDSLDMVVAGIRTYLRVPRFWGTLRARNHSMNSTEMMRESVSHPDPTTPSNQSIGQRLQWCVLVGMGTLTILTGIGILIALMSPESIRSAPTVALVCVLVLLCVPVPVLMLERSHRKVVSVTVGTAGPTVLPPSRPDRQAVVHASHLPHNTKPAIHRSKVGTNERTAPTRSRFVSH